MKKIDIKLYVMACMLLVSSLSFGQLKFGDKSTVGQTLSLDNATGVATIDLTFNTDKSLSSIVLNTDSAAVGKDYYDISISKCQNNKGFGAAVYDESDQEVVNGDFKCRLGRMNSYENPVRVASTDSLISILDAYAVNDAGTSTSKQKPAHCLFDQADDDQAFGAWPGKYKKVALGLNVKFDGYSLDTDITFSIDTYDEGNTGATASYALTVLIAGVDTVTIPDYYVTGSGLKNVSLAADAGFTPADFSGQNVFCYLKTDGTGTIIADDSFDPVIVIDDVKVIYNSPAWIKPAAGIEANAFKSSMLKGEAGVETTFAVPIQTKNRMAALTIVNDLYLNGDGAERPFTIPETGALMANDGSGNYTVDVAYTLEPSVFDAGSGKWSDAKITVAAPPSGIVNDDMMLFFKATPVAGEELISRFELDHGVRIFYDVTVVDMSTRVAYVNEDQSMESTAQVDNDPIVQMMSMDPNFTVDVFVIAEDSVVDLSGYDMIVVQETFGSGSAIYTPSGILGLENIDVPFIYNKAYALRDGKAITDATDPKPAAVDPGFLPYLTVSADNQSNKLFNGITFDGDSVRLFNSGANDDGVDGSKAMQYVTNLDIIGAGNVPNDTSMIGLITGVDDATAAVCVNVIPAGTLLGEQDTIMAQMIAICQNYGAICKDGNMTDANLTMWRNAFYLAAGMEVPADAFDNTIDVEVSAANAVMMGSDDNAYQITVPSGSTSVDLEVNVINGKDAVIPEISGLSDGMDGEYELKVYAPAGVDSMVYTIYVHVQSEEEILYLSASNGVYATANPFDTNIYDALTEDGYSVTFAKKGSIFEYTPDGINAFDYTPYAGMVIGGGESSSNVNDFAKRNYPIPCVSLQNDGPKNNKWGWTNDKLSSEFAKTSDLTVETAKIKILDNTHPITAGYAMDQLITWSAGTPDSADWPKEVKSYNLADSVPGAIALATINDPTLYPTMWAVPAGTEVRSMNGDYDTYERVTTTSNVVLLYVFNDGLLYMTEDFKPLIVRSLKWAMGANMCEFEPYYSELENLTPDPECSDISLWNGWGLKSVVTGDEAYCGRTSVMLIDTAGTTDCNYPNGDAAMDVANFAWQPNTTYHLRVMVKTIDGSIGFLAKGSVDDSGLTNDFNFSYDSHGEWMQVDTMFTTSASPVAGFFSFNTCDNSTASITYIDNYELYAMPPYHVIMVTKSLSAYDMAVVDSINKHEDFYVTTYVPDGGDGVITTDDVAALDEADVVVIGRNIGSDKVGAAKDAWDEITAPVLCMNMYGIRSNSGRAFWTPTVGATNVTSNPDTVLTSEIVKPGDAVFEGVTGTSIDYWQGMFSVFVPDDENDDAGNGELLMKTTDNAPLFMRWEKDVEFYPGAGHAPKGDRTYLGNGNDNTEVVYFGFTEAGKTIFFNELARMASGEPLVIPRIKKVAYVTAGATPDPISDMLSADDNLEVDVVDGTGDYSGYDVVVGQESFGSSDAVWSDGGSLYLKNSVPMLMNKTWAWKSGKPAVTSDASVDRITDVTVTVDEANQSNPLFSGITFTDNTIRLYKAPVSDAGLDVLNGLYLSDGNTLLASASNVVAEDSAIVINDIPAGTQIGNNAEDITGARIIAFCMFYGNLTDVTNVSSENMTIWRNAVYMLAGLTPPAELYVNEEYNLGVHNVYNDAFVSVYPNPARDVVNISFGLDRKAAVSVSVYTVSGQLVKTREAKIYERGEQKLIVNTSEMKAGLYIYKLNVGEKSSTGVLSITK